MNKLIKAILTFSLLNRGFIFLVAAAWIVFGLIAYKNLPIEAFPDVTNTQVTIITQWPGRSAEEIEKFVTLPIEINLNSVQKRTDIRSTTLFGLSVIKVIFEDGVDDAFARQQVNNLIGNTDLPDGIKPEIQPPYGPTGEIYRYTLETDGSHSVRELKTIQDWVIDRQLRSVPGVADINSFGGEVKSFEVQVIPAKLSSFDITPLEVYAALASSNVNVGGDVIIKSNQAYVVRGIGLLNNLLDIQNVIIKNIDGTPIYVKNVAEVVETALPRLGQAGRDNRDDVVEAIIVMRKGENPSLVLDRVVQKVDEINAKSLPDGVKIKPFYNRQTLISFATETVLHNLLEGIILVTLIVLLFLADWRTTVIVSIVIPLALLFAFICLYLKGMSANLLSMGAIDFGIIVDGAVVMVEGIFVALDHKAKEVGMERFNRLSKLGLIRETGTGLAKAIFFAKVIIITCLLPIFSFTKVEGKMFSPLAYTLGFALLGALIATLFIVPMLINLLLNKNVKERHNPIVHNLEIGVMWLFDKAYRFKNVTLISGIVIVSAGFASFHFLGSEFLPQLNEGSIYVRASMPMSIGLDQSVRYTNQIRRIFLQYPEVRQVLSQTGRPNDGTDPTGFFNIEFFVDLKPSKEWPNKMTKETLIADMNHALSIYPGVNFNFSQPIMDNVEEAASGVKGSIAVKIYGTDLVKCEQYTSQLVRLLKPVKGIKDLGMVPSIGQPELRIELDETKMATYGVTKADAQATIEMAIGGKAATQIFEGEKKFDLRLRYSAAYRSDEEQISRLKVPTQNNQNIPLNAIAKVYTTTGPCIIYRDDTKRFAAIKFSVRGRDMGSTIDEAQAIVKREINLPKGYDIKWTGDFENQQRAQGTLAKVIPVSLLLILLLLFVQFGNLKDSFVVLLNIPFAIIGGIWALMLSGVNFSISAGIGFIALFGICIQNGVILVNIFKHNFAARMPYHVALREGVKQRVRPVLMTALMAMIGLTPAALSKGIGSETQKPLAIVVIGGLISDTLLNLVIFPTAFEFLYKRKYQHTANHKLEQTDETP